MTFAHHNLIFNVKDKRLFGFGRNFEGQLGLSENKFQIQPQELTFFQNKDILDLALGNAISLILTPEGLYSFGMFDFENQFPLHEVEHFRGKEILGLACGLDCFLVLTKEGLYGHGANLTVIFGMNKDPSVEKLPKNEYQSPQKIDFFNTKEVLLMSCGSNHLFILTTDGFYGLGSNKYGQLGLGETHVDYPTELPTPTKLEYFSSHNIICFACSSCHTYVMTHEAVYAFGCNEYGQLGLGHLENETSPQSIPLFEDYIGKLKLYTGLYHAVLYSPQMGLYSFGLNSQGQLGLGHKFDQSSPQRMKFFDNLPPLAIECYARHCLILTTAGLFSFGDNLYGQLGLAESYPSVSQPQPVAFFKDNLTLRFSFNSLHSSR